MLHFNGPTNLRILVCLMRFGVVLGKHGLALAMLLPIVLTQPPKLQSVFGIEFDSSTCLSYLQVLYSHYSFNPQINNKNLEE